MFPMISPDTTRRRRRHRRRRRRRQTRSTLNEAFRTGGPR